MTNENPPIHTNPIQNPPIHTNPIQKEHQKMSNCCSTNETNPAAENGGRENLLGGGADDMTT
ncbi:hypothetical protein L2U97_14035, partial [Staphylococcus aureus]|nr:hypothetical protein [Staphylococcus aureus]